MTTFVTSPNISNILTALRSFLLTILPAGTEVLRGQANRVAEPAGSDFVIMTPLNQRRIETNVDTYQDNLFTASIAGTVMTVSFISIGSVPVGNALSGTGLAGGTTTVLAQLSGTGPGGPGTYSVSLSQNMASSPVAAGAQNFLHPGEHTIQLDVHGPNSSDNTQTIITLFRDAFGVDTIAAAGFDVTPLYADDPKQVPFINDQGQFEDRWIIEAHLQANQGVSASQTFTNVLGPVQLNEVI